MGETRRIQFLQYSVNIPPSDTILDGGWDRSVGGVILSREEYYILL